MRRREVVMAHRRARIVPGGRANGVKRLRRSEGPGWHTSARAGCRGGAGFANASLRARMRRLHSTPSRGTPWPSKSERTRPTSRCSIRRRSPSAFPGEHGRVTVLAHFPGSIHEHLHLKELCTLRDGNRRLTEAQRHRLRNQRRLALLARRVKNSRTCPLRSSRITSTRPSVRMMSSHENLANVGLTVAARSVFVVDPHGNVSWEWVSSKPSDEPQYEDVKRAVEAAAAHRH